MTKQICSVLLAFLLFAATARAQTAQPIEARKPSNNPPELWAPSNGCRFQDSTYCDCLCPSPSRSYQRSPEASDEHVWYAIRLPRQTRSHWSVSRSRYWSHSWSRWEHEVQHPGQFCRGGSSVARLNRLGCGKRDWLSLTPRMLIQLRHTRA